MKNFLIYILILLSNTLYGQCVGNQTVPGPTLNPPPPVNGYLPGTVVTVCYTMVGWPGLNVQTNYLEGFVIDLGPGWTNLTPGTPPINCQGGGGNWLWLITTTSVFTGITVGPGWFFNSQQGCSPCNNALSGDDWGDFGSCTWSFCFSVTVVNSCMSSPGDLLIQVTAGSDGTWGSWNNNGVPVNPCPPTPFTIYNGQINTNLPNISSISHN